MELLLVQRWGGSEEEPSRTFHARDGRNATCLTHGDAVGRPGRAESEPRSNLNNNFAGARSQERSVAGELRLEGLGEQPEELLDIGHG